MAGSNGNKANLAALEMELRLSLAIFIKFFQVLLTFFETLSCYLKLFRVY